MNIVVLGAGTMGVGISQTISQAGFKVYLKDLSVEVVNKNLDKARNNLSKLVAKGKMTQAQADDVMNRIIPVADNSALSEADIVIEAVFEKMDIKKQVLAELDQLTPPSAILASNTSALSITEMATATNRPDKVIGTHFFNPAQIMKLVEVIPGLGTSEETMAKTKDFIEQIGKSPVIIKDSPAFVVSRVLAGLLNEATHVYAEGIASAEDIDKAMKLGANLPMGPLALIDLIGLDIHLAKMDTLFNEFKDTKYRPPQLIRQMVRAGYLGVKTGRGFYTYDKQGK